MTTLRITEEELARDLRAVLDRVQEGREVIIERGDHTTVAVIPSPKRSGRPIDEIIAEAERRGSKVTLDEGFSRDLEDIIKMNQEPWDPPSWD